MWHVRGFLQVYMYSMVHTLSRVPYAGVKGMLQNIFGLDHLGDDTVAIKTALLKVRVVGVQEAYFSQDQHQPVLFLPRVVETTDKTHCFVPKFEYRCFADCFISSFSDKSIYLVLFLLSALNRIVIKSIHHCIWNVNGLLRV